MENYKIIEKSFELDLKQLKTQKNNLSNIRLGFFLLALLMIALYAKYEEILMIYISIISLVFLLYFVIKSTKVNGKINYTTEALNSIEIIQTEDTTDQFEELNGNFQSHIFNKDLDLLEGKSIFNRINKTQTRYGNYKLKFDLTQLILDPIKILQKQLALLELQHKEHWNVKLLTLAKRVNINKDTFVGFQEEVFVNKRMKYLPIVFSIINCIIFIWISYLGFPKKIIFFWILGSLIISALINFIFKNKIARVLSYTNMKGTELENLVQLLKHIETNNFESIYLNSIKDKFLINEDNASQMIKSLSTTKETLDATSFPMVGFILNNMFLWKLYYVIQFEKEIQKTAHLIEPWLKNIAEFETLISFAIFNSKYTNFCVPEIADQPFDFELNNAFHPLLDEKLAVKNSFRTNRPNNIAIITGANMAGKSTFLRTIGTNLVLAMNGANTSAERFRFYPMDLFTSIRTMDNLASGDSYFKNEINKLKILMDLLESGKPQFVILDEILKGTNSEDKLIGSQRFLQKLKDCTTPLICFIATHDLELTKLEIEYPEHIENYCFELKNNNNNFFSDYLLRKGTTQVMNALFLMKQFKIID